MLAAVSDSLAPQHPLVYHACRCWLTEQVARASHRTQDDGTYEFRESFNLFDVDLSGYVPIDEFENAMEELEIGAELSADEMQRLMKMLESKDGLIDFTSFVDFMMMDPDIEDADDDGEDSADEDTPTTLKGAAKGLLQVTVLQVMIGQPRRQQFAWLAFPPAPGRSPGPIAPAIPTAAAGCGRRRNCRTTTLGRILTRTSIQRWRKCGAKGCPLSRTSPTAV